MAEEWCRNCETLWERTPQRGKRPMLCPACTLTHKFCHGCSRSLARASFHSSVRANRASDGLNSRCRQCISAAPVGRVCGKCDQPFSRVDRGAKQGIGRIHLCDACEVGFRWCSRCAKVHCVEEFARTRDKRDGRVAHCKECCAEKRRERLAKSPKLEVARKYGISQAKWDEMFAAQRGLCLICGESPPPESRGLVVDHCHEAGTVRALLCDQCNIGLGHFKDNPDRLLAAAAYLLSRTDVLGCLPQKAG